MTFDWTTLALQLINVLILLAILRHFLFRPVAAIIAKRQQETDRAREAAQAAQAKAEAEAQAARKATEATRAARAETLDAARREAEALRDAIVAQARQEARKIAEDAAATEAARSAEREAHALARARDLAATIALRALANQPADIAGYTGRLCAALDALPETERTALLSGADLKIVSPGPLGAQDRAAVAAALARFGVAPGWDSDPALLAGLELVSATGAVRNSLAHDLDRITEALRNA